MHDPSGASRGRALHAHPARADDGVRAGRAPGVAHRATRVQTHGARSPSKPPTRPSTARFSSTARLPQSTAAPVRRVIRHAADSAAWSTSLAARRPRRSRASTVAIRAHPVKRKVKPKTARGRARVSSHEYATCVGRSARSLEDDRDGACARARRPVTPWLQPPRASGPSSLLGRRPVRSQRDRARSHPAHVNWRPHMNAVETADSKSRLVIRFATIVAAVTSCWPGPRWRLRRQNPDGNQPRQLPTPRARRAPPPEPGHTIVQQVASFTLTPTAAGRPPPATGGLSPHPDNTGNGRSVPLTLAHLAGDDFDLPGSRCTRMRATVCPTTHPLTTTGPLAGGTVFRSSWPAMSPAPERRQIARTGCVRQHLRHDPDGVQHRPRHSHGNAVMSVTRP